jgi:hypothetical protein
VGAAELGRQVQRVSVELNAVMVAVAGDEPHVLVLSSADGRSDALPSGPLQSRHRTLELGLRAWIGEKTRQTIGYVEQLYTFGDRDRAQAARAGARALSIGYLALIAAPSAVDTLPVGWRNWYQYFPWEDLRDGEPQALASIRRACRRWAAAARKAERDIREERVQLAFGDSNGAWNEERVLERYELLYEIGLVPEAHRDGRRTPQAAENVAFTGRPMQGDHRRILATGIARLRGKIKYRPVVFELIPQTFTLSQLQRTVEALSGVRLHAPNFRRLVESQELVEGTGELVSETRGRPAQLVRFRNDVMLDRPVLAQRLPVAR